MALVCLSTPLLTKLKEAACLTRFKPVPGKQNPVQFVSRLMQALKPGLSRLTCDTGNLGQVQTEIENF